MIFPPYIPQFPHAGLTRREPGPLHFFFQKCCGDCEAEVQAGIAFCFSQWHRTTCCFTWRGQEVTELCALTPSVSVTHARRHTHTESHTHEMTFILKMTYCAKKKKKTHTHTHLLLERKQHKGCSKGNYEETCQVLNWAKLSVCTALQEGTYWHINKLHSNAIFYECSSHVAAQLVSDKM